MKQTDPEAMQKDCASLGLEGSALSPDLRRSGLEVNWASLGLSGAGVSALTALTGCGGAQTDVSGLDLPDPSTAVHRFGLLTSNAPEGSGASVLPLGASLRVDTAQVALSSTASSASTSSTSTDANALLNWAEQQYPSLFPGVKTNLTTGVYLYRYYPETQNYLGGECHGHDARQRLCAGAVERRRVGLGGHTPRICLPSQWWRVHAHLGQ